MSAILSILKSPGLWVGGAVFGGVIGSFLYGVHLGGARADAAWQAVVAAETRRQADAANAALDFARRQADAATLELQALQEKVDAYAAEVADRSDVCVVGVDDARRLSGIR